MTALKYAGRQNLLSDGDAGTMPFSLLFHFVFQIVLFQGVGHKVGFATIPSVPFICVYGEY